MTGIIGTWWLWPIEPNHDIEYSHLYGGTDDEPDWIWCEESEDDLIEPALWTAQRLMPATNYAKITDDPTSDVYHLELRQRWFGGTEHEWEPAAVPGSDGLEEMERCVSCRVVRVDIGHISAPYDLKCKPQQGE